MELFRGHRLIKEPFERSGAHAMHKAYLDAVQHRRGLLGITSLLIGVAHQGAVTRYVGGDFDGMTVEHMVNVYSLPESQNGREVVIAFSVFEALEKAQIWKLQEDRRRLNADDLFFGVRASHNPIVEKVMEQLRLQGLRSNPFCPTGIYS